MFDLSHSSWIFLSCLVVLQVGELVVLSLDSHSLSVSLTMRLWIDSAPSKWLNNDCFVPVVFFLQWNDFNTKNMTEFVVGIPILSQRTISAKSTLHRGRRRSCRFFRIWPRSRDKPKAGSAFLSCVFITEMTVIPPKKGEMCTFFAWARNNPY